MKKCLKIVFTLEAPSDLIQEIQKKASKLEVEGSISFLAPQKEVKIIACGLKEQVDKFVDLLHKETALEGIADINIEPFVKTKDYRGAFRVIE